MIIDGISVMGSYHYQNQDSFACKEIKNGYVLVVSDGLGSKKYSKIGSNFLCESVIENVESINYNLKDITPNEFANLVYLSWKDKLKKYDIKQCYATMLFLIIYGNRLFAVRLGDGFIAINADEVIKVLYDKKDYYFANETDCLTERFNVDSLEVYEMEFEEFNGAILCSDGVGIGNMTETEISSFTYEFIDGYNTMSKYDINKDIYSWLNNWSGCDDKTLTYIISERRF